MKLSKLKETVDTLIELGFDEDTDIFVSIPNDTYRVCINYISADVSTKKTITIITDKP